MTTYAFKARDSNGKLVQGIQEAMDEDSAMNSLMGRGLLVLSLEKKRTSKKPKAYTVKLKELVIFTRQLATMINAGLPLVECLTALHDSADPKRQLPLRMVITDLKNRVSGGESFTEALRKHPRVFNRLFVAMVRAGESAGMLDIVLDRLATFLEDAARLASKVRGAMVYPVAVLVIAFGISAFLILQVVPTFSEIYAEFNTSLPGPTQMLIDFSGFAGKYWWILLIALIGGGFAAKMYTRTATGRRMWDKYKLKLPVFGPLLFKVAMTRFSRTFAQLIRSGVPVLEALDIVGETSGNSIISDNMKSVRKTIEDGEAISVALAKNPIFPPMLVRMVSAGEETGNIEEMLDKISDFWDEEITTTLDSLTSLLQPVMIVIIGAIVGSIVVCMFLPIFKLHEIISQ